jgi:phenylpropionate dioxygenase-like ring-hydroxylating dioxygenase large terminal subunit
MKNFLFNGWYAAAWAQELAACGVVGRRILDLPIVLFRSESGTAAALLDRCPHRFAPLSKGQVHGAALACGYHGLSFAADGTCIRSPFNKFIPERAGVRSFPLIERHGVLWIWPGDASIADPASIPDFAFLNDEPGPHGYMFVRANYLLAIDNLMDLSHIEYVHKGSFGGAGAFFEGEHTAELDEQRNVWSRWSMPNVPAPMPARPIVGDVRVNHWQDMRWSAPASLMFTFGVVPLEVELRSPSQFPPQAHLLTPETQGSTHYFYSRNIRTATAPGAKDLLTVAFEEEDRPMMEACFANMQGTFWEEKPLILATDRAAVMVRRAIEKMLKVELGDAVT